MTSTLSPQMASLISVTSSGRSSIRRMIRCMSGLFLRIDFATSFSKVVLPAFGGDTIIPLCPLPIGLIRSTILMATVPPGLSIISLSFLVYAVFSITQKRKWYAPLFINATYHFFSSFIYFYPVIYLIPSLLLLQ